MKSGLESNTPHSPSGRRIQSLRAFRQPREEGSHRQADYVCLLCLELARVARVGGYSIAPRIPPGPLDSRWMVLEKEVFCYLCVVVHLSLTPLGPAMKGVWGPKCAPKVEFGAPLWARNEWGLGPKASSKSRFWSPFRASFEWGLGSKVSSTSRFWSPLGASYEWGLGSKVSSKSRFWSPLGASYEGGLESKVSSKSRFWNPPWGRL